MTWWNCQLFNNVHLFDESLYGEVEQLASTAFATFKANSALFVNNDINVRNAQTCIELINVRDGLHECGLTAMECCHLIEYFVTI